MSNTELFKAGNRAARAAEDALWAGLSKSASEAAEAPQDTTGSLFGCLQDEVSDEEAAEQEAIEAREVAALCCA